jgi:tungstate transport system permease protein
MEIVREILDLLFGANGELRQIVGVTLRMSFTSTAIAAGVGLPLGVLIGVSRFRGRGLLLRLLHTLMGLPPVVAGLITFFLLSRSGPLGQYKLLYSVPAMVVAQVMLITPIVMGLAASAAGGIAPRLRETAAGIGLSRGRVLLCALYACRSSLISVLFTGFGRAISEVGAAQIVGGNIQYKTRIMTTAIVLESNRGDFRMAVALGVVLLLIAFVLLSAAQFFQERG